MQAALTNPRRWWNINSNVPKSIKNMRNFMDRQWEREEEEVVAQKSHKYQLVPRRRFHGPFDTVALGLSGCSNTPERIVSPLSPPFTLLALSFDELFGQVDRCPAASLVGRMGFVVVAWCIVGACSPLVQTRVACWVHERGPGSSETPTDTEGRAGGGGGGAYGWPRRRFGQGRGWFSRGQS